MSKKQTYVVNFISGPGCGKTTLSAIIFAELKLKQYVSEFAQEYAKQLVWMKDFETLNNQHYVTRHQYKLLKQMDGIVDFIVTDGPLIHGIYYNLHNKDNTSNRDKTHEMILNCHNEFKNINIFLTRGEHEYETQGRIQTESESREIDVILKHLLKANNIDFVEFPANSHRDNINKILEYIIEHMK